MGLIKSSVLASICGAIHNLAPGAVTCKTSYRHLSTRHAHYQTEHSKGHRRQYATVSGDLNHHQESGTSTQKHCGWPDTPSGHSCPTPYQILATSKDAAYTKTKFYELVKLYHPDRNGQGSVSGNDHNSIPQNIRLERYRLIVTAHTILSDPGKRHAYDQWGAGWAGRKDAPSFSAYHGQANTSTGPFTSWRHERESDIWSNATWEDWERWRERQKRGGQDQDPVYVQNSTFVGLLLTFAAIGSTLNFSRADSEGAKFLAARDVIHDHASRELRRVRQMTHDRPKDERIDWFLKNREATLTGVSLEELREERARQLLPPEEKCNGPVLRSK